MIEFDRKKDKVAIIAPASGCRNAQGRMDQSNSFERLNSTIDFFKQYGFECVYDKQIFAGDKLEYFAASRSVRAQQLKNALENPEIKIISAFRGGYGCSEIVFDCFDIVPSGPKILIGFSDITILHLLFDQYYKIPSIHGNMQFKNTQEFEKILSVFKGNDVYIKLEPLSVIAKDSVVTGNMFGGNLTLLCNMIGTRLHPQTEGKILFIEDVSEAGYRVHRNLVHMYNAGLFDQVQGVIFGDFTDSDQDIDSSIEAFIEGYLQKIPVYKGPDIGHGNINHPIIIGGRGVISGSDLKIYSPFNLV